jgi:hypothetical protein
MSCWRSCAAASAIRSNHERLNNLVGRRVPAGQVNAIEDEILALRARSKANGATMMTLVERARRGNDQHPDHGQVDLEQALHAMPYEPEH